MPFWRRDRETHAWLGELVAWLEADSARLNARLDRSDQAEADFGVFARDLITRLDKRLAELDREFARRQAETNVRLAQIQADGEAGRAALWAILDKLNGPATA